MTFWVRTCDARIVMRTLSRGHVITIVSWRRRRGGHVTSSSSFPALTWHVRLDVLAVQAVAELLDAARDLVVADDLLLAVALDDVDVVVVLGDAGLVPLQGRGPARFRF